MTRLLFAVAFLLGTAAVVMMGANFVESDTLALVVTVIIGGVYAVGFIELLQFRQATSTLTGSLASLSEQGSNRITVLDEWLIKLHPSLHSSVRLRIEGDRVALPAPVLTPYFVSLLVMLGLLGTFVGMVDTLKGAVVALEGSTELEAIRKGLTAPMGGLALAFGTSVAGVAASAMLGLMSALSRRERIFATHQLDDKIATVLRRFSMTHDRQETFRALQIQSQSLPEIAEKLHLLADRMEHTSSNLGERLVANQDRFHESAETVYRDLAASVDKSLRDSVAENRRVLAESGRMVGEGVRPVVREAMASISSEIGQSVRSTHLQLGRTAKDQLQTVSEQFARTSEEVARVWQEALSAHEALIEARVETQTTWLEVHSQRMDQLTATFRSELVTLRDEEAKRGQAAVDRLMDLESTVTNHLSTLGKALEDPMTRLIQTASETPRAAAEVLGQLRREISNNIERDNTLLEERSRLMADLDAVSDSLTQASSGQSTAIERLVDSSREMLQQIGEQFSRHVATEVSKGSEIADHFAVSAAEISSLGEAFSVAINLYNDSNSRLIESLRHIESSLDKSSTRSDEQLGYYVAQAREVIDYSVLTQKEIFDELRQLGVNNANAHDPAKVN